MEYGSGARKTSPEKVRSNIFALLEIHGLTQEKAGRMCGMHGNYFTMLKGQKLVCFPRLDKLLLLCGALNVSIEDLLYKDYTAALDQKRMREIDADVERLKKERAKINDRILQRAKERRAREEAEGRKEDAKT